MMEFLFYVTMEIQNKEAKLIMYVIKEEKSVKTLLFYSYQHEQK